MKEKRIVYFDYLRILAVFAVVMIHVAANKWKSIAVDSYEWQILNVYDGMVRWGVAVFVMISGALFLGKEQSLRKIYKKNVLRMFIAYVFWSSFYAAVGYFLFHATDSVKGMLLTIIKGHYHLWFILMIAGLYMVSPFLNRIVSDRKTAVYFVVLAFVFAFLLPQCIKILGLKYSGGANLIGKFISNMKVKMVVGYSGFYVLGYLLNTCEIKKKWRIAAYIFGLLAILFTIGATSFVSLRQHSPTSSFYDDTTVNTLLAAVAIFLFAKTHFNKPVSSPKKQALLVFVSKCTFGVYLIHPFLLKAANTWLNISPLSFNPLASVPVLSLVIFAASLLISALLNKIPIVKTWIV